MGCWLQKKEGNFPFTMVFIKVCLVQKAILLTSHYSFTPSCLSSLSNSRSALFFSSFLHIDLVLPFSGCTAARTRYRLCFSPPALFKLLSSHSSAPPAVPFYVLVSFRVLRRNPPQMSSCVTFQRCGCFDP